MEAISGRECGRERVSPDGNANPGLDLDLRPLHLTDEEKPALLAFLRSLSGRIREGNR